MGVAVFVKGVGVSKALHRSVRRCFMSYSYKIYGFFRWAHHFIYETVLAPKQHIILDVKSKHHTALC